MRPDVLQGKEQVEKTLERLLNLRNASDAELQKISKSREHVSTTDLPALQSLYLRYSFLLRWIDQLAEWKTRLAALS